MVTVIEVPDAAVSVEGEIVGVLYPLASRAMISSTATTATTRCKAVMATATMSSLTMATTTSFKTEITAARTGTTMARIDLSSVTRHDA